MAEGSLQAKRRACKASQRRTRAGVAVGDSGSMARTQIRRCSAVVISAAIEAEALPHIAVTSKGYEMQSPIVQLDFNTTKPPFDNAKVRQAVAYVLPYDKIFDLEEITAKLSASLL